MALRGSSVRAGLGWASLRAENPRVPGIARASRPGRRIKARTKATVRSGRIVLRWRFAKGTKALQVRVRVQRSKRVRKSLVAGAWKTITVANLPKPLPISKAPPARSSPSRHRASGDGGTTTLDVFDPGGESDPVTFG